MDAHPDNQEGQVKKPQEDIVIRTPLPFKYKGKHKSTPLKRWLPVYFVAALSSLSLGKIGRYL